MSHIQPLRDSGNGAACYSCGQGLSAHAAATAGEVDRSGRLELCPDCARMLHDELSRVLGEAGRSEGERAGG